MQRPVQRLTVGLTAAALMAVGIAVPATAAAAVETVPTDLIISEYVEGSSTNKAVELYNPTGADIPLAGYSLSVYFNGSTTSTYSPSLTGTVPAGGTFVFADNLLAAYAQQTTGAGLWNGDDAIVLKKADAVIDSLGQVGVDPGTEWGTGLTSTADNTLRRNASVCVGDTDPSDAFDPAAEWTGYAQNTFDGLGSHAVACGETGPQEPVINEFSASTAGTDTEYVEILVEPGTDVSGYRVLEIEGDSGSAMGVIDEVIAFDPADDSGRSLAWLPANALENGTISLLLVEGFTGAVGDDLDAENDGVIDAVGGLTILDSIAVNDGGGGDLAYGDTVLTVAYDGLDFAPGAASRIPDGTDTGTTDDWVRNDFDRAGIPGFTGTLDDGEAANTPGAQNSLTVVVVPLPPADCNAATVTIGSVQGPGAESPVAGTSVQVEGVVVGDFQDGGFDGYYLQDAGDGDTATSDGVFVYAPNGMDVAEGDVVHISGIVSEFFGMTEITATANSVCDSGALPPAAELSLPATPEQKEALEGMRVTLPQPLAILEFFEFGRFGTLMLGTDRQMQPTAVYDAGTPEAIALAEENELNRIGLDDGRSEENPDPAIHPNGAEFTLQNTFRGGDLVSGATGVLDYRFDTWAVQPTQGADYEAVNARSDAPEVGGNFTVASFNVLNYFTTLGSRGANDQEEFDRQEAKIVSALAEIDADVFGLIEIENNGDTAVGTLVEALNAEVGAGTYDFVSTGVLGTDVITTAFIYKPSEVELAGDFAVLDETVDERFDTSRNRPALAQTFADVETGEEVTVVVNHLKSKGSACAGDPDLGDGQGNCNLTRTAAAEAMVDWLATGPTGAEPGRELIIGDLNSYDKEDPIQVLTGAGYTDLLLSEQGENAYSYVFDGQLGYLDYALAGPGLLPKVTGAAAWAVNADEPSLIDYDTTFKKDAQDALYAPDAYRSSDHDPVLVGFDFVPPELSVTVDPDLVFPPNAKWQTVMFEIEATDDSGAEVEVEVEATAEGHKAQVEVVSVTEARVLARQGAVYTFVFEATDPSGNVTTQEVTVTVGP